MQFADLPVETIELALSYIDCNCDRDTWARVGMAVKNELGDAGFDIWDAWSRRADNYDQRDARDTWRSVKAHGGVTIATVIHMAREAGYQTEPNPRTIDPAEADARRERREADAQREAEERERAQARAAQTAAQIWEHAEAIDGHQHAYLQRKGITAPGAVRIGTYWRWHAEAGGEIDVHNALIIPIRTPDKLLASVQAIFPDDKNPLGRDRDYLPGGRKQGCYFNIGMPTGEVGELVMIGEGYATCASAHQATEAMAVVAFDGGNLLPVAQAIRAKIPHATIVILADDDRWGKTNAGIKAAKAAATAVGGFVAVPAFASDEGQPTDFNDLHLREGLAVVQDQIKAAMLPKEKAAEPANDNIEPLDIFAECPAPPLRRGMLPRAIEDYAFECGELLGVSPGMVAIPALVACAAALHDEVKIKVKRHEDWRESARLWCAVVGEPSVKKSPSMARATKRLRKIDIDLSDENARRQADYADQMEQFKEAKKEAKKLGGGFVKAPDAPKIERMVVEDATVEALSEVLKDNARGVLCVQDELSGWFGMMDAYTGNKGGSKDRAAWLQAYNGGGRVVDRVMRGSFKIPNWSVSMIGGIQPDAIRRIASNMTEDGLMQRFMIIIGENAPEFDYPTSGEAYSGFSQLVDHLYAVRSGGKDVTMTDGAHVIRQALNAYAAELAQYPALPGGLRSHLGKWSGLFARLLLIFHAIECADQSIHPADLEVSAETASRVDRLMRKFLLPHAMAYYTDVLGNSGDLEHGRWIAGHILSKKLSVITNRDITQAYKQWRGLDDWRRQRIMAMLEDMGWLTPYTEEGAKPSRRGANQWAVTTRVHEMFAEKAQVEATRRDRLRAEIAAMQAR
jgi:phage/plasmid primase-like uncharacterized protein